MRLTADGRFSSDGSHLLALALVKVKAAVRGEIAMSVSDKAASRALTRAALSPRVERVRLSD